MKRLNITGNRKEYSVKNLLFDYDKLNDLLYVYKKDSHVYSNVMIGEFHLEFNKSGELIGMEILNASDILADYGIPKRSLDNIQKIDLKTVVRNNSILVFVVIKALNHERSATVMMNNLESPIMHMIASA